MFTANFLNIKTTFSFVTVDKRLNKNNQENSNPLPEKRKPLQYLNLELNCVQTKSPLSLPCSYIHGLFDSSLLTLFNSRELSFISYLPLVSDKVKVKYEFEKVIPEARCSYLRHLPSNCHGWVYHSALYSSF